MSQLLNNWQFLVPLSKQLRRLSLVVLTVCSSTHFSFPPLPSTNRWCIIWKWTGGPPKAVKPRSHVRMKTSISRSAREVLFPWGDAELSRTLWVRARNSEILRRIGSGRRMVTVLQVVEKDPDKVEGALEMFAGISSEAFWEPIIGEICCISDEINHLGGALQFLGFWTRAKAHWVKTVSIKSHSSRAK